MIFKTVRRKIKEFANGSDTKERVRPYCLSLFGNQIYSAKKIYSSNNSDVALERKIFFDERA